ncbi:MAG TPA: DUF6065 family protein [Acetobacteraceae bacterium]|nr:DUF6065 family protein [Acetobacteraceae bacterium]
MTEPIVRFHRLIPSVPAPERADRSGLGMLPTRAFRYCDAVTTAAGFGWHVFAPLDFSLLWDGEEVCWTMDGLDEWLPLGAAQFPDFRTLFDSAAPEDVQGYSPPFLSAIPEPGVVQVWTGLLARTAPGWSLLLRAPANLPKAPGYEAYEGVVETDRWFLPLFINLRLTRTDSPVLISTERPLLQAQPLPQFAYADSVLNAAPLVEALESWGEAEWNAYRRTIVEPSVNPEPTPGRYATEVRRNRRSGGCPFAALAKSAVPA